MGMTIDERIAQLVRVKHYAAPRHYETLDVAVDTMRKYQKICEIVDKWNEGIYDDEGLTHTEVMELVSDEVYEDGNDD